MDLNNALDAATSDIPTEVYVLLGPFDLISAALIAAEVESQWANAPVEVRGRLETAETLAKTFAQDVPPTEGTGIEDPRAEPSLDVFAAVESSDQSR